VLEHLRNCSLACFIFFVKILKSNKFFVVVVFRVRMLNVFEPCTLQIGDRNFYTLKESDIIMMRNEWRQIEKDSFVGIAGGIGEPSKSKIKRLKKTAMAKKTEDADEEYDSDSAADEECSNKVYIN
jgi:hypothetical protein